MGPRSRRPARPPIMQLDFRRIEKPGIFVVFFPFKWLPDFRPVFCPSACSQAVDAGALSWIARLRIVQVHSPSKSGFGTMESFRNTLLTNPKLTPCRDAVPKNPPFFLPSGTLMIVTPEQYENVRQALIGSELKPYNLMSASTLRVLSRK